MIPLNLKLNQDWAWSSDWMGEEVGLNCESVGYYTSPIEFLQTQMMKTKLH